MILRKAYQFKLKPDGATGRKLSRFCGCARFVYNKALAWNRDQRSSDPNFKISYAKNFFRNGRLPRKRSGSPSATVRSFNKASRI